MDLKAQVLGRLIKAGDWVRGPQLAMELQVTRAGIARAIQQLKATGTTIESHPKLGYRFERTTQLNAALIQQLLDDAWQLEVWETLGSTQDRARQLASAEGNDLIAVVANQQTAGYGRRDREFYSPAQTGVYLSIVSPLPADWTPDAAGFLTGAVAVMVSEELQRLVPSEKIKIKWVNDLYLHDRKVAGILTEGWQALDTSQPPKVIVGIGINLNPSEWPAAIADRATGITTQTVDRNQLVQGLLKRWPTVLATYRDERWLSAYRQRQWLIGKQVTLQYGQQLITGVVQGIDNQYGLELATQTGVKTYGAGEVTQVRL